MRIGVRMKCGRGGDDAAIDALRVASAFLVLRNGQAGERRFDARPGFRDALLQVFAPRNRVA